MFGFSFSELGVVVLVALVVIGPKDLPKVLRCLGRWAGTIRQTATALRTQSGIDEILRSDGLADDLAEIRKLARGELDAVQDAVRVKVEAEALMAPEDSTRHAADDGDGCPHEYPRDGADAYGALPDGTMVDVGALRPSRWARDPLYVTGDPGAEVLRLGGNGAIGAGSETAAPTPQEPWTEDEPSTEDDHHLPVRKVPDEMRTEP